METNETVLKEIDFMQIRKPEPDARFCCLTNSHLPAWMSAAAVLHPEKLHC